MSETIFTRGRQFDKHLLNVYHKIAQVVDRLAHHILLPLTIYNDHRNSSRLRTT
jgi:hypothetical protein